MSQTPPRTPPPEAQLSTLDIFKSKYAKRLLRKLAINSTPGDHSVWELQPDSELPEERPENLSQTAWQLLQDIPKLGLRSISALLKIKEAAVLNEDIEDRQYVMEELIQSAVKLSGDALGNKVTDAFITTLWGDLKHPPEMYLGDKFQYRTADGSYNSFLHPHMGEANQPYARTVKPQRLQSANLPDPEVVFDSVLCRKHATPHPTGISSVLFYLASIIIHDIFKTSHRDHNISLTSSYLDLAPLYGSSEKEQMAMRTGKDGQLKPDCFSETRLLNFPPGVGVLLIMFNRFHNHVVTQLAMINEQGRFDKPNSMNRKTAEQYDNDLFQTGRLITCGLYVNLILIDYVRTILNLNRTDKNWQLNPRLDFPGGPEMGTGNQVSAEFNLVYRWHAAISDRDDKWTQDQYARLFDNRKPSEVSQEEFLHKLAEIEIKLIGESPEQRPFAELERVDGNFKDDDLVKIIVEGIEDRANAFGPRQVPAVMKAIEVLGMQQARSWNLATLNEFRKHFSLAPHTTWESITTDVDVQDQLMRLYGEPDNVELYPGLVVEDAKESRKPGSGLCPSFTVSRAVLSDAVALVRGDRFYTTAYHPKSLTNWGYSEANYDVNVDNGCVFYKLFLRAFPGHFDPTSSYIHYPLTIPSEMRNVFDNLGMTHLYNTERPHIAGVSKIHQVSSHQDVKKILDDTDNFDWILAPAISLLAKSGHPHEHNRTAIHAAMRLSSVTDEAEFLGHARVYFERETEKLLSNSYILADFKEIDIVKDVVSLAPVHFCAEVFSIPLKTEHHKQGIITPNELRDLMTAISFCLSRYDDVQAVISHHLSHVKIQLLRDKFQEEIEYVRINKQYSKEHERRHHNPQSPLWSIGLRYICNLLDHGINAREAFTVMLIVASSVATTQSTLMAESIDYILRKEVSKIRMLQKLANENIGKHDEPLLGYVRELVRLSSETATFREAMHDTMLEGSNVEIPKGSPVMCVSRLASRDPAVFDKPDEVNPGRPAELYLPLDQNLNIPIWEKINAVALTAMFKTILRQCNGLRQAKIWNGKSCKARLYRVPAPVLYSPPTLSSQAERTQTDEVVHVDESPTSERSNEKGEEKSACHAYLTEKWDCLSPFPTTLKVNWDLPGSSSDLSGSVNKTTHIVSNHGYPTPDTSPKPTQQDFSQGST